MLVHSKSFNCRGLDCGFSGLGKLSGSCAFCCAQCGFDYIVRLFSQTFWSRCPAGSMRTKVNEWDVKAAPGRDKVAALHACQWCRMWRERSATDTIPRSFSEVSFPALLSFPMSVLPEDDTCLSSVPPCLSGRTLFLLAPSQRQEFLIYDCSLFH